MKNNEGPPMRFEDLMAALKKIDQMPTVLPAQAIVIHPDVYKAACDQAEKEGVSVSEILGRLYW